MSLVARKLEVTLGHYKCILLCYHVHGEIKIIKCTGSTTQ